MRKDKNVSFGKAAEYQRPQIREQEEDGQKQEEDGQKQEEDGQKQEKDITPEVVTGDDKLSTRTLRLTDPESQSEFSHYIRL